LSQEHERDGFLSRWSKRKLQAEEGTEQHRDDAAPVEETLAEDSVAEAPASEQEKPIWQRDDVDADTKKTALRQLFRKPEFNIRDGLNEYDDDFTQFAGLGSIVTHEMKRMLKLAEEKTRPSEQSQPSSEPDPEQDSNQPDKDKEDNDLA